MRAISLFLILLMSFAASAQTARVIADSANLRGTPTNSGKVVQKLRQGNEVEVIKQKGPWFLVQSTEYVGWIHGKTIRIGDKSNEAQEDLGSGVVIVPVPGGGSIGLSEPRLGMTAAQVRAAWGEPEDINRTISAFGVNEQWVYPRYTSKTTEVGSQFLKEEKEYRTTFEKKTAYVYFRNGRVTSISR